MKQLCLISTASASANNCQTMAKAVEELFHKLKGISASEDLNLDNDETDCSSTDSVASDSDEDIQMLRKRKDSSADSSSVEVEDEVQLEVTLPSRGQISPINQTLTEVRNGLAWLAEPSQRKKLKAMEKKEGMDKIEIIKKEYPEILKEVALLLYTMPVTQCLWS